MEEYDELLVCELCSDAAGFTIKEHDIQKLRSSVRTTGNINPLLECQGPVAVEQ